jgi:hypothetical protein
LRVPAIVVSSIDGETAAAGSVCVLKFANFTGIFRILPIGTAVLVRERVIHRQRPLIRPTPWMQFRKEATPEIYPSSTFPIKAPYYFAWEITGKSI